MSILMGKKMNWNHWSRVSDLTRMKYTVMLVPGNLINFKFYSFPRKIISRPA